MITSSGCDHHEGLAPTLEAGKLAEENKAITDIMYKGDENSENSNESLQTEKRTSQDHSEVLYPNKASWERNVILFIFLFLCSPLIISLFPHWQNITLALQNFIEKES